VDAQSLNSCLEWFSLTQKHNEPWPREMNYGHGKPAYVSIVRVKERLHLSPELTEAGKVRCPEDEEFDDDEDDRGPIFVKMKLPYVVPAVYMRIWRFS
jgi:hypothetical protein